MTDMVGQRAGAAAVTPLLPVEVGKAGIPYAQGMAAGPWVFATGHIAQAYPSGFDPEVVSAGLPHGGLPRNQKEAAVIFDRIGAVFASAGTGLENVVRVDQYYPTHTAVDHYHVVRRRRLPTVPPSTSMLMRELSVPGAEMNVQAIGVVPEKGLRPQAIVNPSIDAHPTSGYSATLCAGDWVFVAGMTPTAKAGHPMRNGLAEAAQMAPGMLWRGTPIKLEAEYAITEKIVPALEAGGSSLANVCKAQVYLSHGEDYSAFMEVWNRHFGASPPALSIIPCSNPGMGQLAARVEINVLAVKDKAAIRKSIIGGDRFTGFAGVPEAVHCGDLLFLSGLMAVDERGLLASAAADQAQPYLCAPGKAQMRAILRRAQHICGQAGTSLSNILRIQHFHTDLGEMLQALEAWQEVLPNYPLPFSAVGVPDRMPAPGVSLIADLWVYAP